MDNKTTPKTIKEAVDQLINDIFTEEDIQYIKNNDDVQYHFGIGMKLRNGWSLWDKKSLIVKDAIENYGISHGDDISGLIFEWSFATIRKQEFDPKNLIQKYDEHWKIYGTTALKAGE